MTTIFLGSASASRGKIMSFFSLPFTQIPSQFNEESVVFLGDPVEYVKTLSYKKSETLAERFPEEIILTADTTIYRDGRIYNKPKNEKEAQEFLSEFSGKWHSVFTGLTVRRNLAVFTDFAETKLLFNSLSLQQIEKFHACFDSCSSAGGYAIEQSGSLLVSAIEGCYYNVLGLPLNVVRRLLLHFGIDLWDFIKPIL